MTAPTMPPVVGPDPAGDGARPRVCDVHAMVAVWVCRKCGCAEAPHQPDGPHPYPLHAHQDGASRG